ncbi:poly(3-hydroxybutyrate) depolymerase [Cupriavidus basilensis OR16]|uniref:Poly(3-hydroxybutyrate) depolymerase n=1 Tax=Cupriavidus basilensis OR16 TaxID=1127483 RepID=H1S6Y7_9BURK|nr:poly(3-hydroxybutyrate) depolymerase [Cupriavidus basilensis OR16]
MTRRKGSGAKLWNTLSQIATRHVRRAQRTVTKSAIRSALKQGEAMSKAAQRVLTGVASPAPTPVSRGGGRWEEGNWGLGPLVQRRYRLFIPPGVSASRPASLLVLLHGCGQDTASFAACTRAATLARAVGCMVLMPEQSPQANAQRCWNWFRSAARVVAEASLLMAIVDHVCQHHPIRRERVFALGLSAGGAMAVILGLRYPDRFAAVGSHSGAVPLSASNAAQAARVMHGKGLPDVDAARFQLAGRRPPHLLLLHGDADRVVHFDNALACAALWQQLPPRPPVAGQAAPGPARAAPPLQPLCVVERGRTLYPAGAHRRARACVERRPVQPGLRRSVRSRCLAYRVAVFHAVPGSTPARHARAGAQGGCLMVMKAMKAMKPITAMMG